jgi:aspartyl protease family protein
MARQGDDWPDGPWSAPAPAHPRFGTRLAILIAVALLGLWGLLTAFPPQGWDEGSQMNLVFYGLLAAVFLVRAAASHRSLAGMAGGLTVWGLVLLALVLGYSYRFELRGITQRITGELVPTRGQEVGAGSLSFARSADGHFRIDATVDGKPLRFLVDTGATGVALTRADAARLGFAPETLSYTQRLQTANGTVRGAPVSLREIRIGTLTFDNVPAIVNEGELTQSLLGMRLLERLSRIEIRDGKLYLAQ